MPLRPVRVCVLVAVLLASAAGLAQAARPKPFDVPEQQFFDRVHKVVLTPCRFPRRFESDSLSARADSVAGQVDSSLVAALTAGGLEVVPSRESGAVIQAIVDSLGGVYDPVTGEADSVREATIDRLARERVRALYAPDAIVFTHVFHTTAPFAGTTATWHGVSDRMTDESFGRGFLKRMTFQNADSDYRGTIGAISLHVAIEDTSGTSYYSWAGGLQTTMRIKEGKFVDLPASQYFVDRSRVPRAVDAALDGFTKAARKRRGAGR